MHESVDAASARPPLTRFGIILEKRKDGQTEGKRRLIDECQFSSGFSLERAERTSEVNIMMMIHHGNYQHIFRELASPTCASVDRKMFRIDNWQRSIEAFAPSPSHCPLDVVVAAVSHPISLPH